MVLRPRLDQFAVLDLDVDAASGGRSGRGNVAELNGRRQVTLADAPGCSPDAFVASSGPDVN